MLLFMSLNVNLNVIINRTSRSDLNIVTLRTMQNFLSARIHAMVDINRMLLV